MRSLGYSFMMSLCYLLQMQRLALEFFNSCFFQETSSFRMRHLQSLHKFVSRATAELIWLNGKEEEELACDWSDSNPNISAKKTYFSVSVPQQDRHAE